MKVGRIPYLSCEPFYFEMERRGMALYDVVPSAMARAIAQGEIDAGPVPLSDCFRLSDHFRFLSGFCVATIRTTGNVMLHAKQPIEALSGARIGWSEHHTINHFFDNRCWCDGLRHHIAQSFTKPARR